MRLHRFFVKEKIENPNFSVKDKDLANQIKNVLRLKKGERVIILDGSGFEFECGIESLETTRIDFSVLKKIKKMDEKEFNLELLPALIKKDRLEWVLEKGTELGVNKFSPIISERSVKQNLNLERAKKIIKEASEQSGKVRLPGISPPENLASYIKNRNFNKFYFALDPRGEELVLNKIRLRDSAVFIGPEGGFSEKEIDFFKENKIPVYSLGQEILRSETASIVICSLILLGE